mgnify:FL=1
MFQSKEMPYVLYVAETIYLKICEIKKENLDFSNTDAVKKFIGSKLYKEISNGKFHNKWFENLEKDNFVDKKTNNKIPEETLRLLRVQKDLMMKQLIQFPDLYYTKDNIPLEISQRAFDHLWRICESYELWCKETDQPNLLVLKIID